jgi:DNA invertase Pin-like site-specific DNA recombinase
VTEETECVQRAVAYLRIASPHAGDAAAIVHQREACRRIAAKHGLTIVREYADVGRPARLEQQGELQRLLGDLAALRDAASVVVWDYARLARDMAQLDEIISQLRVRGAEVVTMTGVEAAQRFVHRQIADGPSADALRAHRPSDPPEPGAAYD